jgi:hypothetical protein
VAILIFWLIYLYRVPLLGHLEYSRFREEFGKEEKRRLKTHHFF